MVRLREAVVPRCQRLPTPEGLLDVPFSVPRPQIGRLFLEGNNITDAGAKKLAGVHGPEGDAQLAHIHQIFIYA